MRKSLVLLLVLFILCDNYTNAQLSKVIRNVKSAVQKEISGDKDQKKESKTLPEPAGACTQPELVFDLGGKYKIDYTEINITIGDDGSILVQDRLSSSYFIAKSGTVQGPFNQGDKQLEIFGVSGENNQDDALLLKYKEYITRRGDKFLIKFLGKEYGPFAEIQQFIVTKSKEKFVAMVIENVLVTQDQGKTMEEAMKNAKTDQERMDLAMKYAQEMQKSMMKNGPTGSLPKYITNIPGITYDPVKSMGAQFNGNFKFNDILLYSYNTITDLNGNMVLGLSQDKYTPDNLFISADNSNYAIYNMGTITLKDNTKLTEVFNPHWLKSDGKIFLAYLYYSPKRNSIMLCKIPF